MKAKVKKESIRIRSVEVFYAAILYLDEMYGTEESELTFPDGHPLVSLTRVSREAKDGTEVVELVLSDRWPKGAVPSRGFQFRRDHFGE
ncbi:MAG: hypothetical protein WCE75_04750 [Terracidiphilus sp.]